MSIEYDYTGLAPNLRTLLENLENKKNFDYVNFVTSNETTNQIGGMYWDNENGTISVNLSNNVKLQLGQENHVMAVNKTQFTITNGSVVHITGATGNRPKIEKFDITNLSSNCVLGIATEDILKNEYGYVCVLGIVRGLNTQGISEGTKLYATTNGNYSTTIPNDGYRRFWVGIVIKEHVSDGWVFVNIREIPYLFGDLENSNYSLFESNGVLKMLGTACVWDDLQPRAIISARLGANAPTLTTFKGNIRQLTFAVNDYVEDNVEFLHWYKEGSNFDIHIHIATNGLEAVDKYVKFSVEYCISDGTTLVFSDAVTIVQEILIPANTPDRKMLIIPIDGDIIGTNVKIGSVICARITRMASSGTAVANNPFVLQWSVHAQRDTLGSRTRYTK